jgi:dTDP-4-dehydrorhamnose reductase
MASSNLLVTGADGQLGKALRKLAPAHKSFDFIFLSRKDFPIENSIGVLDFFEKTRPSLCINCAAYTAVDRAETEKAIAFAVNADSVASLAKACHRFQTKLIHVSTDYVFDGNSSKPLTEDDRTGPVNVYGASKLRGEELAFENNSETVIFRTSWVYSEFGNNFVKTMIRLMKEKESINVVEDQIGSPTYARDLAETILAIAGGSHFVPGIYNYSNEGAISWYDFAVAIRELIQSDCKVNPIPSSQFPTPAKRPHYSLLDKSKIKEVYGVVIPGWLESLRSCISAIQKSSV